MDHFAVISIVFYFLSALLASHQLFSSRVTPNLIFTSLSCVALFTHTIWLYQNIFMVDGQNLPILNVVSLVSFIIALLSLAISKKLNTGVLLPIVYGFNILNFFAVAYLPSHYVTHLEHNPQVGSHIIYALLAYSVLTIASLFALQLAYIDHRLKTHKAPLTNFRFPPMMTMEKSLFQLVLIGFILLTCALATGFIFLEDMFAQHKAHKAVFSIIAWFIYATLLWGHFKRGWRGRLVIYITIIGSSLLTLAYFGSRIVREIIL